jgi:hypothetical protein
MRAERYAPTIAASARIAALAALASLLCACEYLSKPEPTRFTAVDGGFKFRAIADAGYPEGSANGEAWRMKWLEQRLAETRTCPNGYTITSREAVLQSTGTLGSIYDVYYRGRCT